MALRAVEHTFTGSTTSISSYDSTKTNLGTLMIQKSGTNPEDNFVGPLPVAVARPLEESTAIATHLPHVITFSSTIDWVFVMENATTQTKRIFLYEYNKSLATYNWKGFITATTNNTGTVTNRGFKTIRYLHTTGTVAVAAPSSFYSTGTVSLSGNTVTGVGTTFAITHVGKMIGFGSTNVAQINCWYPIITFTSTTSIGVSGASSAIAAGTAFVIASCTVTGSSTQFVTDLVAAGTASTGVAGGLGPRIGFGSTDPTQITKWYHIGAIASDTSLNLTTSPGVIPAGTAYVIEELRFAIITTNNTTTSGGLFLLKGAGYHDFTTSGTTFPAIASNIKNERGVYWLADAATVTNTAAAGIALAPETNKTTHYAYVLDGANTTTAKIFRYNLCANDTVAAGKMTLAGSNIVITGNFSVTGTIPNTAAGNLELATAAHGPGSGVSYVYFVTLTRLYCAAVSGLTAGSTTYITASDARQEIPPGGVISFPATGGMYGIRYIDSIDRFVVVTASAATRQYVTRYPATDTTPFDHVFGIDDKERHQSLMSSYVAPHFSTLSQFVSCGVSNGIIHIINHGVTAALHRMYTIPVAAHWTYAYLTSPSNHQRVITPSISTPDCVKFDQLLVFDNHYVGVGNLKVVPESFRTYYRTTDINTDATSSWTLLGDDGDLSGVTAASAIQFMFEFFVIGGLCIPAQIMKVAVTYEDNATDSHFELSSGISDTTNERFAWRFRHGFGGTVPTLKIELFDMSNGSSILTDTTVAAANGTWEKSTNGGGSWSAYNTTDKTNEITYIRYTPTSLTNDLVVKAVLTQN